MVILSPFAWSLLLAISVVCLLLARRMYRVGKRGVVLDQTPVCSACRFNLTGRPADSVRCSECGADLSAPHAIHIGNWRINRLAMAGAAVWLSVALVLGGFDAATVVRSGFYPVMPVWLLARMATSENGIWRNRAMAEIVRRENRLMLDGADHRTLALRAIAVEGNAKIPWPAAWSGWITRAGEEGMLSVEDLRRSAEQTPYHPVLWMRLSGSDPSELRVWMRVPPIRGNGMFSLHSADRDREVWIDGEKLPGGDPNSTAESVVQWDGDAMLAHFSGHRGGRPLPRGNHQIYFKQRCSVRGSLRQQGQVRFTEPLRWIDLEYRGTFQVSGQSSVTKVSNPNLATPIANAIRVQRLDAGEAETAHLSVSVDNTLPADVGFSVSAQWEDYDVKIGQFCASKGVRTSVGFSGGKLVFPADLNQVDLIFRSEPAAGEDSPTITQIWSGEFTIAKVPILRSE